MYPLNLEEDTLTVNMPKRFEEIRRAIVGAMEGKVLRIRFSRAASDFHMTVLQRLVDDESVAVGDGCIDQLRGRIGTMGWNDPRFREIDVRLLLFFDFDTFKSLFVRCTEELTVIN